MRWNLLYEVLEIERGLKARASAHWPQDALRPELFFLEIMAQTAGLIFGSLDDFQTDIVFAKVDQAQFYSVVPKEALLTVHACAEDIRAEGGWFKVQISCEGSAIAEARLLLANAGRLKPDSKSSVTFHEQFMNLYKVRNKVNATGMPS